MKERGHVLSAFNYIYFFYQLRVSTKLGHYQDCPQEKYKCKTLRYQSELFKKSWLSMKFYDFFSIKYKGPNVAESD